MKKLTRTAAPRRAPRMRPLLTIGFSLLLALFSAALTYSVPPSTPGEATTGAFLLQATATPPADDLSEIGSTDGIVVMGFVIVLIVIVPILLQRKSWMESP
jgi:hypothetical protein